MWSLSAILPSAFSGAIDQVTKTPANTSFSHMGIIEIKQGRVQVIHSNSYAGVCREPLDTFRARNGQPGDSIFVYRILNLDKKRLDRALLKADKLIGAPYNRTYRIDDEGYYCSEFIYLLFEKDSVFNLDPMTFIDPLTGTFHPVWEQHYKGLGIDIPEGEPGCNPNGMAASPNLEFIGKI